MKSLTPLALFTLAATVSASVAAPQTQATATHDTAPAPTQQVEAPLGGPSYFDSWKRHQDYKGEKEEEKEEDEEKEKHHRHHAGRGGRGGRGGGQTSSACTPTTVVSFSSLGRGGGGVYVSSTRMCATPSPAARGGGGGRGGGVVAP